MDGPVGGTRIWLVVSALEVLKVQAPFLGFSEGRREMTHSPKRKSLEDLWKASFLLEAGCRDACLWSPGNPQQKGPW